MNRGDTCQSPSSAMCVGWRGGKVLLEAYAGKRGQRQGTAFWL